MTDFLDRALSWGLDSLLREDDDDDDMPDVSDLLSDDSVLWDQSTSLLPEYSDHELLFPEFDLATTSEDLSDEDSMELAYPPSDSPFSLPFEKRFEATKRSLEECMKKSQETRRSLTLTSPEHEGMKEFLKQRTSVQGVVESVQASTRKLQKWVVPTQQQQENATKGNKTRR
jgi:hypothetical protein